MNFKDFLNNEESRERKLSKDLENVFKRTFTNSFVKTEVSETSIKLWFTLGKGQAEYVDRKDINDPAFHVFMVWIEGEKMELERIDGEGFKVTSDPSKGSCKDVHRVIFRKAAGGPDDIIKGFDLYLKRFKKELSDNKERVCDQHKLSYKIEDKLK